MCRLLAVVNSGAGLIAHGTPVAKRALEVAICDLKFRTRLSPGWSSASELSSDWHRRRSLSPQQTAADRPLLRTSAVDGRTTAAPRQMPVEGEWCHPRLPPAACWGTAGPATPAGSPSSERSLIWPPPKTI